MQRLIRPAGQNRNDISSAIGTPLEPAQLKRIESVHRGFLYQHLYAVAFLLTSARLAGNSLTVERDEDVEFSTQGQRTYIQVKTRSRPLQQGDISGALKNFEALRAEHLKGRRTSASAFAIVSNAEPGPELLKLLDGEEWPADVAVITPLRPGNELLPPAWPNIEAAIGWCVNTALDVPFGSLAPETLVWKLAAIIQYAAAGARDHKFEASDIPALLEQLLAQLQDFPDPPPDYRPQIDEPPLLSDQRVRLISGFSGAGKTAWASQAALHCPAPVAYYDVGDLPGASVANALARELVARFGGGRRHGAGGAVLAASAGLDVLRVCAAYLQREGLKVTVVLDNAHRMSAQAIRSIVEAAPNLHFLLIGQPWEGQAHVEANFSIGAERLGGWSRDDIAAEFRSAGSALSLETATRVARLTGALPLYVRGAARLSTSNYAGNAEAFCDALESLTHVQATAQEIILGDIFARLSEDGRTAAGVLSLVDFALTSEEAVDLVGLALGSGSSAPVAIRELRRMSIAIGYQGDRLGIHDALRPLAKAVVDKFGAELSRALLERLFAMLMRSLIRERNIPRFNALLSLLPRIGRTDALADLASDERFHEQGDPRALKEELERAAQDPDGSALDRYWAHDALAYWESRDGGRTSVERLAEMNALVRQGNLGRREKLGLLFKELAAAGYDGDRAAIERIYGSGKALLAGDPLFSRLLRYNRAVALYRVEEYAAVIEAIEPLIAEYYSAVGLKEADLLMKSNAQLYALLPQPVDTDALKRLADSLSLWACARVGLNLAPMLRRIHAVKLYALAQAGRSAVTTGLEIVDDFLTLMADPIGARQTMEQIVLPAVAEFQPTDMIIPVRSHHAIVLAWCGEIAEARREMRALSEYAGSREQHAMLAERKRFIDDIAAGRVRLIRQLPPAGALRSIPGAEKVLARKIGRNEPCPCGSGRKYKRCHGAN